MPQGHRRLRAGLPGAIPPAMYGPTFQSFVAPARARSELWRLLLGVLVCVGVYAGLVGLLLGVFWAIPRGGVAESNAGLLNPETPGGMLAVLSTFMGMALGPVVAVRLVHGRGGWTLFGRGAIALRHFVVAAVFAGGVLAATVLIWLQFYETVPGLPLARWVWFLPLSLLAVLLQTGAEEMLFRGYLQQQLAARFRSPLAWAVLPAVVFGLLHSDPAAAGDNVWLVVGAATLFGLYAADLTAKTGSIGAAWGFHFANNVLAILVIATDGTLTGLALYITPYGVEDVEAMRRALPVDLAVMTVIWLVLRRMLAR